MFNQLHLERKSKKMLKLLPGFVILLILSYTKAQKESHFIGNRSVIVHMFEWAWRDIAKECEDFLGPQGYAGVQVRIEEIKEKKIVS